MAELEAQGVDTSPIVAVSEQRIAQAGETEVFVEDPVDPAAPGVVGTYSVIGVDSAFFRATEFELKSRAAGYGSDEEVWNAVAGDPTLAVIPGNLTSEGGRLLGVRPAQARRRLGGRRLRSRSPSSSTLPERS